MLELQLSFGWHVRGTIDEDNHLRIYIHNNDGSDILPIDDADGNGRDGEELELRFTTAAIEATYHEENTPVDPTLHLIQDMQEFIHTWKPCAGRDALAEMEELDTRIAVLLKEKGEQS